MAAGTIREYDEISTSLSSSFMRDNYDSGINRLNLSDTDAGVIFRDSDTVQSWQTWNSHLPPDLSIFCEACSRHVPLRHLVEHRLYHRCLAALGYGCYDDQGVQQHDWQPEHLDELLQRRHEILQTLTMNSKGPVGLVNIRNVNEAFEYLKNELEGFQKCPRGVVDLDEEFYNLEGEGIDSDCKSILAIGTCSVQNRKWKSQMEDRYSIQDSLGGHTGTCFIGVFDGYGGSRSAQFSCENLHESLVCELCEFDSNYVCKCKDVSSHRQETYPNNIRQNHNEIDIHRLSKDIMKNIIKSCEHHLNDLQGSATVSRNQETSASYSTDEIRNDSPASSLTPKPCPNLTSKRRSTAKRTRRQNLRKAFERAHYQCDSQLSDGKREKSRVRWSGCSTLCALVIEGDQGEAKIHVSNAGHIHGVLLRGDQFYMLSKDHSTLDKSECNRIINEGGLISSSDESLWNHSPRLNGVLPATRGLGSHGDSVIKKCVIPKPAFTSAKLDEFAQVLILATSGLWNVLDPSQVSNLVIQLLQSLQPNSRLSSPFLPTVTTTHPTKQASASLSSSYESNETEDVLRQIYGSNCDKSQSGLNSYAGSHFNVEDSKQVSLYISETLVRAALMAGSRDNISVVCLLLPGSIVK